MPNDTAEPTTDHPEHADHTAHHEHQEHDHHELMFGNMKRTYDEYQGLSLDDRRRQQTHSEELFGERQAARDKASVAFYETLTRSRDHNTNIQEAIVKHLNNVINNINSTETKELKDSEIATDRQWNVNETDAIATSLADAIAEAVTGQKRTKIKDGDSQEVEVTAD